MVFHPFEVTIPHVAYACLGGFVVIFGMFSLLLREKLYIGEACWAFLFGVIIGPYGAGIFDPRHWGGSTEVTNMITLEFTRVVLAIGVFAIGVELPKAYMARHWKSMFFLLVPVMTWGWFVSAGLIYALVPGLNFLSSLAVAACLTPTDPILAAAVVGGKYADKHVPAHLRHMLAAESGCNDGAAFPFLYLSLYLIIDAPNTGRAVGDWFLILWLYSIIMAVVIGGLLGFAFRHLMKFCERRNLIDRHSYVAQYISLALLTIGVCTLLGTDDLLAAFACGTAFAWDGFFNRQTEETSFSSVIDLLFNIAAFVFVGAWMPFSNFQDADLTLTVWRLIVIAILVLLLRRLPIMIALYKWIPDVKTFREALFSGHFGPIGIGAVFISTLAAEILHNSHSDNEQTELLARAIQPITAFMVLTSITIHGLSIPSFSLGRRVHSVSLTWSRHAPPDWTTQARHVQRGEDIVVNRDADVESGALPAKPELAVPRARHTDSTSGSTDIAEKPPLSESSSEDTRREEARHAEEAKEETPPDGSEILQQWQEGPDVILERRAGPGEEVEVEVIRNANCDDLPTTRSLLRGPQELMHQQIEPYLHKLRHAPHEVEQDADAVAHAIAQDARHVEEGAKHALHAVAHPGNNMHIVQGDREDEEGWASDRSNPGEASASSIAPQPSNSSDRKRRSKAFIRHAPKLGSRARRRTSARKGLSQDDHNSISPILESTAEEPRGRPSDTRPRKRQADHARPHTADSGNSAFRNNRIDRVLALHASREASPSRSVRFADTEPRSGTSTPRISYHRNDSAIADATPADTPSPESAEDPDSTRHKVTFNLRTK
ncbi:Na(+)/H(+) exchanger family protein [Pleurotus pulmonarius]|nr:hypothetical protein EYR36_005268 [Pleurotus pulmonarius]